MCTTSASKNKIVIPCNLDHFRKHHIYHFCSYFGTQTIPERLDEECLNIGNDTQDSDEKRIQNVDIIQLDISNLSFVNNLQGPSDRNITNNLAFDS